jgi:predicted nucleotide-binding protein
MEEPHRGNTLIEKLERHRGVSYAVILCTPDDVGRAKSKENGDRKREERDRPRQNVVMELGYLIGVMGRERVCILKTPNLEMPSDLHGVGYHLLDENGGWKLKLAKEMKAAGLPVDLNQAR